MATTPLSVEFDLTAGEHRLRVELLSGGPAQLTGLEVADAGPGATENVSGPGRAGEQAQAAAVLTGPAAERALAGEATAVGVARTEAAAAPARAGDVLQGGVQATAAVAEAGRAAGALEESLTGGGFTAFTARTPVLAPGLHTITFRRVSGATALHRSLAAAIVSAAVAEDLAEAARAGDATAASLVGAEAPSDPARAGDAVADGVTHPGSVFSETPADAGRAGDAAVGQRVGTETPAGPAAARDAVTDDVTPGVNVITETVHDAARAGDVAQTEVQGRPEELVHDRAAAGEAIQDQAVRTGDVGDAAAGRDAVADRIVAQITEELAEAARASDVAEAVLAGSEDVAVAAVVLLSPPMIRVLLAEETRMIIPVIEGASTKIRVQIPDGNGGVIADITDYDVKGYLRTSTGSEPIETFQGEAVPGDLSSKDIPILATKTTDRGGWDYSLEVRATKAADVQKTKLVLSIEDV